MSIDSDKKFKDMFILFDRIHERDRRTDRRTPHDGINRSCIASRGTNDNDDDVDDDDDSTDACKRRHSYTDILP